MKSDVARDLKWANEFLPDIKKILAKNTGLFLEINLANEQDDMERATDLVVEVVGGQVAVRIRRDGYKKKYRDWTIRSFRSSGAKTERQKLIEGFARWYLYLWTDSGVVADWILIDLDKVRKANLLSMPRHQYSNNDGTYFVAISVRELKRSACLVDEFQQVATYQAPLFKVY